MKKVGAAKNYAYPSPSDLATRKPDMDRHNSRSVRLVMLPSGLKSKSDGEYHIEIKHEKSLRQTCHTFEA
jgi:hypothetical protein